ncbi:MAG TPA: hypothetical protein VMB50_09210 [Myxococcales bacterium]|nr:hypothetical protein [Myxococcales bacterium]
MNCARRTIYALALCLRSDLPRKWLWAAATLVGIGKVTANWTTGKLGFALLNVQLFGVGMTKFNAYSAWVVTVGFPLGAVVVHRKLRARRLRRAGGDGPGERRQDVSEVGLEIHAPPGLPRPR